MEIKNEFTNGTLSFIPAEAEGRPEEKSIMVHSRVQVEVGRDHLYKMGLVQITELRDFLSAWLIKHNN